MSPFIAIVIAMLVSAALVAPVAIMAGRTSPRGLGVGFAATLTVIAMLQTGLIGTRTLANTDVPIPIANATTESCKRIEEAIAAAGLTLDRSDPAQVKVTSPGAEQMPQELREVLNRCFGSNPARNSPK